MAIHCSLVDELPLKARRSARESELTDIVAQTRAASPRYVMVTAETPEAFQKTYKAMIQYKRRHEIDAPFKMRKLGDQLFIWFEQEDAKAA